MMIDPVEYVLRYGGRCRECADAFGICPTSGLPCNPAEARRAVEHVLKALKYGVDGKFLDNPFPPRLDASTRAMLAHRRVAVKPDDPASKLVRKIQDLILEFEPKAALECIEEHLGYYSAQPDGPALGGFPVVIDETLNADEFKIVGATQTPSPLKREGGR